ncbi:ribosomal protein L1p/L10e family-domain-containing protein [Cantharellus anzutake]|uniref:ribosomal protein L1p/L10e family-domain-containing protein n=1 Tax=Cantharellus anzutake TaxID=1750568 RepID=UPI001903E4B3|nr:ribosomal protein L1p/L10e family-domain-containing protein [Cantharellus anzutake]KAF8333561.1 ribosomal protein L1p/L10e family-domain-containing protein [Cantharellus anzutake]
MEDLICSRVSRAQVKKAVKALSSYTLKLRAEDEKRLVLGAKDDFVYLVIATKPMPSEATSIRPIRIPITYPIVDPRNHPVCLLTKDPQREYKALLTNKQIGFISKVVGIEKLRGKFKAFESRRELVQSHALFLADDRIIHRLPQLWGRYLFKAKTQPLPVNLRSSNLKAELEQAICSAYMHRIQGPCMNVKIATATFTDNQIIENIAIAIPAIVSKIEGGWDNVQSLHIKTSQSVSLPVWSSPHLNLDPTPTDEQPSARESDQGTDLENRVDTKSVPFDAPCPSDPPSPQSTMADQNVSTNQVLHPKGLAVEILKVKCKPASRIKRKGEKDRARRRKIKNRGPKQNVLGGRRGR